MLVHLLHLAAVPHAASFIGLGICGSGVTLRTVFISRVLLHVVLRVKTLIALCALDRFEWVRHV